MHRSLTTVRCLLGGLKSAKHRHVANSDTRVMMIQQDVRVELAIVLANICCAFPDSNVIVSVSKVSLASGSSLSEA